MAEEDLYRQLAEAIRELVAMHMEAGEGVPAPLDEANYSRS
jgi:hypothetical protein